MSGRDRLLSELMIVMRTFVVISLAGLLASSASAATLRVAVSRNGFTGPMTIAVAPRLEGMLPAWSATKTLAAGESAVRFADLKEGLYLVLASGPQPLQRLSAKVNLGTSGATLRLVVPNGKTELAVTLAGRPLAHARASFTHEELRWQTEVETDERGRYAGPLWEPGPYAANVTRAPGTAPHLVDVTLSSAPLAIDVPDRHVTGCVRTAEGEAFAGAVVTLRSESTASTLTARTRSGADGCYEFFGVREGPQTLVASAPSYLASDAARFDARGTGSHQADLVLTRGEQRTVRVIDGRDAVIAGATLFTSCDGHVKSMATTGADGRAGVAVPAGARCTIYAVPAGGSIAAATFDSPAELRIRVPDGSSSLRLVLRSDAGEAFSDLRLLMRIDGTVVPPEVARLLSTHGFALRSNDEGTISLPRIPAGTYEFWPYWTHTEGQAIYEVASEIAAPISVQVLPGRNDATVRLKARQPHK